LFEHLKLSLSIGHRALSIAAASLAALTMLAAPLAAAGRAVTFPSPDGRTVTAVLTEASQNPSAAVVLVPMLGRSKDDWQAVGERLAAANITSVAIDLPGETLPEDAKDLASWQNSVRAAVTFLIGRPEVRPSSIGIAGASLGANLAAVAAADDARVKAIALVSPSLDYRGLSIERPLRQYGSRAALLVASSHDPYAARSVRELANGAPGPREVQWSEAAAHGTLLLTADPDLVRVLVEWFQRTLG
jgi:alpha-beta hydrolase superfamily lysophospholipase